MASEPAATIAKCEIGRGKTALWTSIRVLRDSVFWPDDAGQSEGPRSPNDWLRQVVVTDRDDGTDVNDGADDYRTKVRTRDRSHLRHRLHLCHRFSRRGDRRPGPRARSGNHRSWFRWLVRQL